MGRDRKQGVVPHTYLASAHLQERREPRYKASVEIEVSGIHQNGEVFRERTVTRDLSEWGCGFLLSFELKADDIILVCVIPAETGTLDQARQALFQVVCVVSEGDRWLVGVWKVENSDLRGVSLEKFGKPEDVSREARKCATRENEKLDREQHL